MTHWQYTPGKAHKTARSKLIAHKSRAREALLEFSASQKSSTLEGFETTAKPVIMAAIPSQTAQLQISAPRKPLHTVSPADSLRNNTARASAQ
jgi:hypothetical protein